MSHTAASLLKSPNSKVLESRILMNHASDERFEFLRGRWKLTWERTKKDAKAKHDLLSGKNDREKKNVGTLIGGYESSDEDEEADEAAPPTIPPPPPPESEIPPLPYEDEPEVDDHGHLALTEQATAAESEEEEERQRIRRMKAEEWKRKRAQAKALSES
jgi:hypothetical protein